MNVNPAFGNMVKAAGGRASQIKQAEVAANTPSEKGLPDVARAMADHIDFIGQDHTESEIQSAKARMLEVQQKHPEAFETLADLGDKACPESVMTGYKSGAQPGMFSVEVHQMGFFNSPPTIAGEKTGTLFVDTTPGQDGLQYAFLPLSKESQEITDPHDAWVASMRQEKTERSSGGGDRLVYENLACAVYRSEDGSYYRV